MTPQSRVEAARKLEFALLYVSSHANGSRAFSSKEDRKYIDHIRGSIRNLLLENVYVLRNTNGASARTTLAEAFNSCLERFRTLENVVRATAERPDDDLSAEIQADYILLQYANDSSLRMPLDQCVPLTELFSGEKPITRFFVRMIYARKIVEDVIGDLGLELPTSSAPGGYIQRSIFFEPEFRQSGISLLSYFGEIVERKYPDLDVAVQITQEGSRVTLLITTENGDIDRIEHELSEYGLAITGKRPLEEYQTDSVGMLRLRQKLEIAELEIRQTKEILGIERTQHGARISSLEQQLSFLQSAFTDQSATLYHTIGSLRELTGGTNENLNQSVNALISIIERGITEYDEDEFICNLRVVKEESPSVFESINDLLLKGAVQGAAGNYLYSWLQALQTFA